MGSQPRWGRPGAVQQARPCGACVRHRLPHRGPELRRVPHRAGRCPETSLIFASACSMLPVAWSARPSARRRQLPVTRPTIRLALGERMAAAAIGQDASHAGDHRRDQDDKPDNYDQDVLRESESHIFMTEGSRSTHRASAATSFRYRPCTHQKTPVPTAVPRGYRGGTAAGVRSSTFILRACRLSRERASRSEPQDRVDRDHREGTVQDRSFLFGSAPLRCCGP
jgi:hypothetical protein